MENAKPIPCCVRETKRQAKGNIVNLNLVSYSLLKRQQAACMHITHRVVKATYRIIVSLYQITFIVPQEQDFCVHKHVPLTKTTKFDDTRSIYLVLTSNHLLCDEAMRALMFFRTGWMFFARPMISTSVRSLCHMLSEYLTASFIITSLEWRSSHLKDRFIQRPWT